MIFRQTFAFVALALAVSIAAAQQYPNHMVKIIVPFSAGGGVDILIRAVAVELSKQWGQAVIVENRPGASGIVGAEAAARARPDGHTLLATVNQTFTSNRYLYKTLPYDPERSYVPVTLMAQADQFLLAYPSLAAADLRELVTLVDASPES